MKQLIIVLLFVHYSSFSQTKINMKEHNGVFSIECKVNGIPMDFILDSGASNVSISSTEALFLIKQRLINDEDIIGNIDYKIANGETLEGTVINIKKIEIQDIIINNVKATVVYKLDAPLLLGQSFLSRLGGYTINNNQLIINKSNILNNSDNGKEVYKEYYDSGELHYFGYFVNDKRSGEHKTFYKSGKLKVLGYFENGDIIGEYKEFYEKGKLKKNISFKDGLMDGIAKYFYEDGSLSKSGQYSKGKRNGRWVLYYKTGEIKTTVDFKDNIIIGQSIDYFKNGNLKKVSFYNDKGYPMGEHKEYFENGSLKETILYKNLGTSNLDSDELVSQIQAKISNIRIYTNYYMNGSIKSIKMYKIIDRVGVWEFYDKSGKLIRTEDYNKN